MLQLQKML